MADKLDEIDKHFNGKVTDKEWLGIQKDLKTMLFIVKPIILCSTCLASFWGIIIFSCLHGPPIHIADIGKMIICCISSAFLNEFFISLKDKIQS